MNPFKLEEYLSKFEFSAPYLLCCSDMEPFTLSEMLAMADAKDLARWENLHLGYTQVRGLPELRALIAQSLYPTLSQNNIVCFAGAEEGIFCSLRALCNIGDHVIVLSPAYQSLRDIPKDLGCEVTSISLKEENQWSIDITEITKAINSRTKGMIINFPHNPTGQIISQRDLEILIDVLDRNKIWLFSDEVFSLLSFEMEKRARPAAELYSRAISLDVMSKSFGLAGLRVGWIACQDQDLLARIERVKHYTSICNSSPSEALSVIALNNIERILARSHKILSSNLEILEGFFQRYSDTFSWVKPRGGAIGFVKYLRHEPVSDFVQRLADQAGVLLIPGPVFDISSNHFRIGFGRKNMPDSLNRLINFVESF